MAQTTITIWIDEQDKRLLEEICGQMGLSVSEAYRIFTKAVIQQGCIPFNIGLGRPNSETLEALNDVNNKRNLSGPYRSRDALREALDA